MRMRLSWRLAEIRQSSPRLRREIFPFPTGGHGNVSNPGLRRAAAMALRRAAQYEREVAAAFEEALTLFE